MTDSNTRNVVTPVKQFKVENNSPDQSGQPPRRFSRRKQELKQRRNARGDKRNSGSKKPFKKKGDLQDEIQTKVISVRRVTRVVSGGKRLRFSALVVVGDKNTGRIGFAIKKGSDYQDSVNKASKKAKTKMIKVGLDDAQSLTFPTFTKYKSAKLFLKPAKEGTGLIAGSYIRPIFELAGIHNVYSKIIGSRNKIVGTQALFKALSNYKPINNSLKSKENV